MSFNMMAILAIGLAIAGVTVVRDLFRDRHAIFDDDFTPQDRQRVTQAAFFVLVPISVALHELGHAVMVWVFGAKVVDFGFYFFAGFVSYEGYLTNVQAMLIAAAGTGVNILLATLAMAVVLLKRPSLRAPWNELLVQFAILSIANALIFYPMLDLLTGMNADFRQMYDGGVFWLSAIFGVIHAGTLLGGYWLFKSDRTGARISALTGLPPHVRRGVLGGYNAVGNAPGRSAMPADLTPAESTLRAAMQRVASGWPYPVEPSLVRGQAGVSAGLLQWKRDGAPRAVAVLHRTDGTTEVNLSLGPGGNPGQPSRLRRWRRWEEMPDADELVLALRTGMEETDRLAEATAPLV